MEGPKQLVSVREHRQEIVVNGLGPYLSRRGFPTLIVHDGFIHHRAITGRFPELSGCLGSSAGEFWSYFPFFGTR